MNTPLGGSDILVRAQGLGKSYPKIFRPRDRLRALGRLLLGRADVDAVPVLQEVDLEVRRGESLGLIGENGAGKSTLLKLLTGVLTPTSGSVVVQGRLGALLELGAGFHPEYTGRENVSMAAALYGLRPEEMRDKFEEIIAFADIDRYIDEPVKHYSSGMVVRLGFAIVATIKPDLLITDEVLAVGDESFQRKCVHWLEDYLDGGGTLILVSHSMYHVQKLCRRACWLQHGKVAAYGEVFDVTQSYLAFHERKLAGNSTPRVPSQIQTQEFHLTHLYIDDVDQEAPVFVGYGATVRARAIIHSRNARVPVVVFGISRADGTPVYGVGSDMDRVHPRSIDAHTYCAEIEFSDLTLLPGAYTIKAHPLDTEGVRLFDTLERGLVIKGQSREFGLVRLAHRWTVTGEPASEATSTNFADAGQPS